MAKENTARDVVEAGTAPRTAPERLRDAVMGRLRTAREGGMDRLESMESLYPDLVLEPEVLEQLTSGLLAGSHVLLLGPPGSGKTSLAKAVVGLMPGAVVAVLGCPVHDDPWSLLDPAFAARVPPCPVCRMRFGSAPSPDDIPVEPLTLREGHGMARVQGSPEVFPDNLTGTINLARLEEVGDPNSPLVLEPGKLLQAHRGMLLVDEIGKLPRGTQNVLLQALQERILTPAKSRETFPADMVAIATSNMPDLGNINEALTDRLGNVVVTFPREASLNRRIVDIGLGQDNVAGPYRDAAVQLIQRWRDHVGTDSDLGEVGSNRALVDILRRARGYAALEGEEVLEPRDFHRGALQAMTGRVRARSSDGFDENHARVRAFVDKHWQDAARDGATAYWCRFFQDELKGDRKVGIRVVEAMREHVEGGDAKLRTLLRTDGHPDGKRFARFVQETEGVEREAAPPRIAQVFAALDAFGAFEA